MPPEILNELFEVVVSVCDNLYASKELINKKTVKKLVSLHAQWPDDELELQIPKYINQWRLHNLTLDSEIQGSAEIHRLEKELSNYRSELLHAKQILAKLRVDLRGMLDA